MNCLEFRRTLGADPNHASEASLKHRAECETCAQYAREMLRLNGLIQRALDIPLPPLHADIPPRRAANWYAIAASIIVTLTVALGGAWFFGYPRDSLAAAVVAHMAHEPYAMTASEERVSSALLDGALRAKGLRLLKPINDVSYLQSCEIRGEFVPHLVVQTRGGPVTVLLFAQEKLRRDERFDEQTYHGMLIPLAHGTMAVLATDPALIEHVAASVRDSVGSL